jgi:hypothetical protein
VPPVELLSVQRVLVHRSIYHSTLTAITVGEAERVAGEVQRAVAVGATLVTDGSRSGPFMTPTVLTDVSRNDPIWTDEIFGPVVVVVCPFDALEEAVARWPRSTPGCRPACSPSTSTSLWSWPTCSGSARS